MKYIQVKTTDGREFRCVLEDHEPDTDALLYVERVAHTCTLGAELHQLSPNLIPKLSREELEEFNQRNVID